MDAPTKIPTTLFRTFYISSKRRKRAGTAKKETDRRNKNKCIKAQNVCIPNRNTQPHTGAQVIFPSQFVTISNQTDSECDYRTISSNCAECAPIQWAIGYVSITGRTRAARPASNVQARQRCRRINFYISCDNFRTT